VAALLNLAEAAAWLGIGQSTLRQKLYRGEGPPAIKLPGSDRWRFRPCDLDAYIQASVLPPVIDPPPLSPSVEARRKAHEAREAEAGAKPAPKPKRRTREREVA
jgi:predicted DNA-binding transcriptional regulator AlpA